MHSPLSLLLESAQQTAQTDGHGTEIGDLIDLDLRVELVTLLQQGPDLVGGDSIDATAEGDQLNKLGIIVTACIVGSSVES